MMRALWSASTGMIAQQTNIDQISNNLANVNTTGYKKTSMDFQDLLYANMRQPGTVNSRGVAIPTGFQVGMGVRAAGIRTDYSSGNLEQTNNPYDLALTSDAFFEINLPDGQIAYTRSGGFRIDGQGSLVTVEGYRLNITNTDGKELYFDPNQNIAIAANGNIVMSVESNVDADIWVPQAGSTLTENPTGFYTGDFEQWSKGDSSTESLPKERYYKVEMPNGEEAYVRESAFSLDDDGNIVTTHKAPDSEGNLVPAKLSTSTLPEMGNGVVQVSINDQGKFEILKTVGQIGLKRFINPNGLEKKGQNILFASVASGEPKAIDRDSEQLAVGFLETSNVQAAEEMVKMITAQRAYELNSKAIQTADDMLQTANNLKR